MDAEEISVHRHVYNCTVLDVMMNSAAENALRTIVYALRICDRRSSQSSDFG